MTLKEMIAKKINDYERQKSCMMEFAAWLAKRDIELEAGSVSAWSEEFIDIDHPNRADVERLLALLRIGKWIKEKFGTTLNYVSEQPLFGSYRIRFWAADPPGTCRLVEEEVVIPAQPEKREKRIVLHCESQEAQ